MIEGNPWLSGETPERPTVVAEARPVVDSAGPRRPLDKQRGVPVPDRVDQLPTAEHLTEARAWWLGVHGGAGESTLAQLTPQWPSAEHAWPVISTPTNTPTRVVLVARSNAHGLRAAQFAAAQWASFSVPEPVQVLGLAIVADAPGRLPRPLRELSELVSGAVPHTWFIPWVEAWRLGEAPAAEAAPAAVNKVLRAIEALLPPVHRPSSSTR